MMDIRMQAQIQQANKDLQKKKQDQNKNKKFHLGVEISLEVILINHSRERYIFVKFLIEFKLIQNKPVFNIVYNILLQIVKSYTRFGNLNLRVKIILKGDAQKVLIVFENKGVLKFPPDYPKGAPSFYLDPVITDKGAERYDNSKFLQDHQLCVHLFIFWDMQNNRIDEVPRIDEIQILQAVEYIFNNPDIADGCPNPMFQSESPQRKQEIQQRQAEFLPFFNKDI